MIPKTRQTVIASALVSPGRLLLLARRKPLTRFGRSKYAVLQATQHGRIEELGQLSGFFPRLVFRFTVSTLRG